MKISTRLAYALVLFASLWPTPATAQTSGVIYVDGSEAPGVGSRIIQELTLLDLTVRAIELSESASPAEYLSPEVRVVVEVDRQGVDMWLRGASPSKSERLRVARGADMSDELLSLRAVELLRGRLLPLKVTEPDQPASPASEAAEPSRAPTAPARASTRDLFEAELGAGVTWTSGLPVAMHLNVAASVLLPYGFSVGPFAHLPFGLSNVDFIGGGLKVGQFAYGAQLGWSFSPSALFRFGASAELGIRHVVFNHEPSLPFTPSSGSEIIPLLGLGVQGDVWPWSWLGLRAELRGAASGTRQILSVSGVTPPISMEVDTPKSTIVVGSQLATQLSLVGRW